MQVRNGGEIKNLETLFDRNYRIVKIDILIFTNKLRFDTNRTVCLLQTSKENCNIVNN